ncbi:MAG: prolyl oligopeptidase family serine peptidase [Deltaproteobacteria bacterium]|nr:prolyl oligopeptidase family serine peptidase [Deltaproteobacteria bacterium]
MNTVRPIAASENRAERRGLRISLLAALLCQLACSFGERLPQEDTTPPGVLQVEPEGDEVDASADAIEILFDEPVAAVQLEIQPFKSIEIEPAGEEAARVRFRLLRGLVGDATYSCSVLASDLAGNRMTEPFAWTFSTALPPDANACRWARDGVCDEPGNCTYGTDWDDCRSACALGDRLHLHAGACAFREPSDPRPPDASAGTGGSEHWTGHIEGAIGTPDGEGSGSIMRHYRLYVPAHYRPDTPAPLVLYLPGHRVSVAETAQYTELMRTAELHRFILVLVEQQWRWSDFKWAWWTDWPWRSGAENHPDLVFLERLVDHLAAQYSLDASRIFVTGHSRGAAMALIAALERPDLFAGACCQSGFVEYGYHERIQHYSGRHVPLVLVHGTVDPDVRIDCRPADACSQGRNCGTVAASDCLVELLEEQGWTDDALFYFRLDSVAHRWQPQLNEIWWALLNARPLGASRLAESDP